MKKEVKVIAIVLAAILVFLGGVGLGATKGINISVEMKGAAQSANVPAAPQATAAPAPVAPQTTAAPAPVAPADTTAAPEAPAAPADTTAAPAAPAAPEAPAAPSAIPSTPAEVVAKYNEVINNCKKEQAMTIHRTTNTSMELTDCSVGFLKGVVNSILPSIAKPSDETWQITGNLGPNGEPATNHIMPQNRDSALTEAGVVSATATAEGDGYKMEITLVSEKSTYDGTNTTDPVNHNSCMIPLNLATIELPMGAKIASADMTYPGAKIVATVNGQGKLVKLTNSLPMEGSGTGELKGASLTIGIKGAMDEAYDFTY